MGCDLCKDPGVRGYCYNCSIYTPYNAQEEKEMTCKQVGEPLTCRLCKKAYTTDLTDTLICDVCREEGAKERARKKKDDLESELLERWDMAFYAALTGYCARPFWESVEGGQRQHLNPHEEAAREADSTIRRHVDMMASRDKLIAEVAG